MAGLFTFGSLPSGGGAPTSSFGNAPNGGVDKLPDGGGLLGPLPKGGLASGGLPVVSGVGSFGAEGNESLGICGVSIVPGVRGSGNFGSGVVCGGSGLEDWFSGDWFGSG